MTIRESIEAVSELVRQQRASSGDHSSAKADELQNAAVAAICAGQGNPAAKALTPEWEKYMRLFAGNSDNPQQLARLLPTDGTHADAKMQKERAYLVSNGICGANTTDDLADGGVTINLDKQE